MKMKLVQYQGERGVSIFLFGFCLAVLVPSIGLAVDATLMYLAQTKLSAAVDSAALAGTRALSRGSNDALQQQAAIDTATSYFVKNYPANYLATTSISPPSVVIANSGGWRTVTVNASIQFPLTFMRWLGPGSNSSTINASAAATRRDVNVVLVLDHSGSLETSGSCLPMKNAATAFLGQFAQGRDNVGLVTFATGSNVDVPPNSNFLSGSTDISAMISSINCASSTNTSSGLWKAYQQLAALNQPVALNAILLFTDGIPTIFTAWNHVQNAACSANGWTKGVIADRGLGEPIQAAIAAESPLPSSGCSWTGGSWNASDVTEVWNRDVWGNQLDISYSPTTVTGTTLPNIGSSLLNASINATISASQRIRSGVQDVTWHPVNGSGSSGPAVPGVVIYTIGLGNSGAPPEANLLMTVANDPRAPNPDPSTAQGMYIFASDSNALAAAFLRVASELQRLAR